MESLDEPTSQTDSFVIKLKKKKNASTPSKAGPLSKTSSITKNASRSFGKKNSSTNNNSGNGDAKKAKELFTSEEGLNNNNMCEVVKQDRYKEVIEHFKQAFVPQQTKNQLPHNLAAVRTLFDHFFDGNVEQKEKIAIIEVKTSNKF